MQPELLALNPSWIINNQRTIAVNFYWDFMAGTNSNFFEGQMDMGLIYRPDLSIETWLFNLEEEDGGTTWCLQVKVVLVSQYQLPIL